MIYERLWQGISPGRYSPLNFTQATIKLFEQDQILTKIIDYCDGAIVYDLAKEFGPGTLSIFVKQNISPLSQVNVLFNPIWCPKKGPRRECCYGVVSLNGSYDSCIKAAQS